MNIEITDELIVELEKLKVLGNNDSFDDFAIALKDMSEKLDLRPEVILKILYSEEFLHKIVAKKTITIDRLIEEKEKEIVRLKGDKYAYGSLICKLHGHRPIKTDADCYCENCGRRVNMSSIQREYEKGLQNRKIYERK